MIRTFLEEECSTINLHALPQNSGIFKPSAIYEQTKLECEYYFKQNFVDMFAKLEKRLTNILNSDLSLVSTCGTSFMNFVAVISCVDVDDIVLVDPNVHKSIIHSLQLRKARVEYMPMISDCVYKSVDFDSISDERKYDAVILSNGTYEGIVYKMDDVMNILAKCSKNIIIDEAWGFINNFLNENQFTALSNYVQGTNLIVTHSIHKTLPVMRQVSCLSVISEECNFISEIVKNKVKFHTTSPNYNLLCSLEAVVEALENKSFDFKTYTSNIAAFKSEFLKFRNISLFKLSSNKYAKITSVKLLLTIKKIEVPNVYRYLRKNKIYCSYVSEKHILMHLLIDKTVEDYTYILKVLEKLDEYISKARLEEVCKYPPGRIEYRLEKEDLKEIYD